MRTSSGNLTLHYFLPKIPPDVPWLICHKKTEIPSLF